MEMISALLALCGGNPPVTGGFPHKGPVMQSFGFLCCGSSSNFISNKYMETSIYNTIAFMMTAMFACTLSVATRKSRGLSSWLPMLISQRSCQPHNPDASYLRWTYIDRLEQERRNSIANALELRLSPTNPLIRHHCNVSFFIGVSQWAVITSARSDQGRQFTNHDQFIPEQSDDHPLTL